MKKFGLLWKIRQFKVWLIVTSSLLVLFLTINLVLINVTFLNNTLNIVFGGPERTLVDGDPDAGYQLFQPDYETKEETVEAGNALNETINEEGIILLKNDGNILPLVGNDISVFGKNSINLVYGGSGSGGGDTSTAKNLYDSLEDAGFNVNPTLKSFYESSESGSGRPTNPAIEGGVLTGFPTGETPLSSYTNEVKDSYDSYDDAALVVISRVGGEGFDLPRTMKTGNSIIDGAASMDDHYLELDQNEQDLLEDVSKNFDKVILIINSSATMEIGFLDSESDNDETQNDYDYASNVQAALWIGGPGNTGVMALGRVLNGEVNPSGRTIDTYARDFSKDPTWANFSNNFDRFGNQYTYDGKNKLYFFVDYEEGIYVGYRYYETRGFTDGEDWYEENVVYPFGYGLSYTSFEWEVIDSSPNDNGVIPENEEITITVKVTNTGDVAGKDVVQLYVTAPYTNGEIEKSHVVLVGFEKTDLIEPGKSDTVTLTLSAYDMASYDFADKNDNDFKGYELEEGNYELKVSKNAHEAVETINYTVPDGGYLFDEDPDTGTKVENRFDDVSEGLDSTLSRSNWEGTWPTTPTDADRILTTEILEALESRNAFNPTTSVIPQQATSELSSEEATVKISELIDLGYDDPLWDSLLNQLTFDQMVYLIGHAAFQTINIDNIGLPKTIMADGPAGFVNFMGDPSINNTVYYAAPAVVAATWNKQLANDMGIMVGNEGIFGNQAGDKTPYTGWYAPAINIHRSPFSGRNFEYYSEDGFLSGVMAANVVKGAESKGVITYIKHFALNDQETRREINGLVTWADEQSMREIYLKAFEIAVKDGEATGIMSSFNRIGTVWAGGSYPLLTEILRDEWGFRGSVITDFNLQPYMDTTQMVLAGGDLNLSQSKPPVSEFTDPTYTQALRTATKNILYSVANSNAMNQYNLTFKYGLAPWVKFMYVVDAVAIVGLATWGGFVIKKSFKKI